ncbi:MAG: hypothetical protein ACI4II_06605 [Acutalibacteraceae bacterium]
MRQKKIYDDDDGRVIADMNIDGMPWTDGRRYNLPSIMPRMKRREMQHTDEEDTLPDDGVVLRPKEEKITLTRKETFSLIINALAAALLIFAIIGIAAAAFILFCTKVWFAH